MIGSSDNGVQSSDYISVTGNTIQISIQANGTFVAGVIGMLSDTSTAATVTLKDCTFNVNITNPSAGSRTAGVAGYIQAKELNVTGNTLNVTISADQGWRIGGLLGFIQDIQTITVTNNKNSTVKIAQPNAYDNGQRANVYIGGLVAQLPSSRTMGTAITLTGNTSFHCEIDAPNDPYAYIGGIVGHMQALDACPINITSSSNNMTGSITSAEGNEKVGRLIGKRYRYSSSSLLWNKTDLSSAMESFANSGWSIKDFTGATWDIGGASSTTTTG